METILVRPFEILFCEPMLITITLYISVSVAIWKRDESIVDNPSQSVYSCVYLLVEAYPVVFMVQLECVCV
jgi:hypothetical protein